MNIEEFNTMVNANTLTICKFGAEWCGPCKTLETTLDSFKNRYPEVEIIKIDVEDEPELAAHFRIRSVPVLLYYKDGELKDKTVGGVSETTIVEKIENLKNS